MARYDGWGFPNECSASGIAILPVQGTLRRTWGIGPYSGATGYDGLWTQLMHAAENDEVKAIFMPHNSGGGAVDGLEELAEAIYANSARFGGKPIWAMLADHSHSASYWLASAADKVFMPKLGTAGSIGVGILQARHTEERRGRKERG